MSLQNFSCRKPMIRRQSGALLVEGLVAILVFSIGVLALVGLQAATIRQSSEAIFRTSASVLANQLLGQMWASQAMGSTTVQDRLNTYRHHADKAPCEQGSTPSTEEAVEAWLEEVSSTLPGAEATRQRIAVDNNSQVQVTLCWKSLSEKAWHHYQVTSLISY